MKVLTVIPSYFPATVYGGPVFSTYHTCSELSRLGGVDVFVSTTNANMTGRLDVASNCWLPLNGFSVKYYNETLVGVLSLRLMFSVWKDIRKADMVHVQAIFNTPTPVALFFAKVFNKPVLLSPRGSLGGWCLGNGSKFKKQWLRYLIAPFVKSVIWHVTAEQERQEVLALFPAAMVKVIPNGIDYDQYQNVRNYTRSEFMREYAGCDVVAEKLIVSMGRIQKKKGFDILIRSFHGVRYYYPQAKLLIAGGDEGELQSLLDLVAELNMADAVFFVGAITGQRKVDFLANVDLFVLPSHNENFGNVYLESLAAGTPIVASTNTPWEHVEAAACGRWVPNTVSNTKSAILDLLSSDRDDLRRNAKALASQYSWRGIAFQFKSIFREIMKNEK